MNIHFRFHPKIFLLDDHLKHLLRRSKIVFINFLLYITFFVDPSRLNLIPILILILILYNQIAKLFNGILFRSYNKIVFFSATFSTLLNVILCMTPITLRINSKIRVFNFLFNCITRNNFFSYKSPLTGLSS